MKNIISLLIWKMDQFKYIGREARACIARFDRGALRECDTSNEFKITYPKEYDILRKFHAITPIGWYTTIFLEWLFIWDKYKPILLVGRSRLT